MPARAAKTEDAMYVSTLRLTILTPISSARALVAADRLEIEDEAAPAQPEPEHDEQTHWQAPTSGLRRGPGDPARELGRDRAAFLGSSRIATPPRIDHVDKRDDEGLQGAARDDESVDRSGERGDGEDRPAAPARASRPCRVRCEASRAVATLRTPPTERSVPLVNTASVCPNATRASGSSAVARMSSEPAPTRSGESRM